MVVTARKREENILDVPLSITALTSENIEAKGIGEFKDIISFTPGFHFAEHSVGRADDQIEFCYQGNAYQSRE